MRHKIIRTYYQISLTSCILLLLIGFVNSVGFAQNEISLPKPITTGQSVEVCLNSRDSESSLEGTATEQQIGNILWAAGKSPIVGANRKIYVSKNDGTYLYNPSSNSLTRYSDTGIDQGAFKISWQSDLIFDSSLIYMPALLASVSLWKSSESPVASSPKGLDIVFGVQGTTGLKKEVVAHSSVAEGQLGWLPDPSVDGNDKFEEVLANLNYTDDFTQTNLSLTQLSQILWAGYGCTPHTGTDGRAALTVPSAWADYPLTGKIYVLNENGVYRYHNRKPGDTQYTSRDHRLEQLNANDVRAKLRSSVSGLPEAPLFIILGMEDSKWDVEFAKLEPGFVASNMLIQGSAMGLGIYFNTQFSSAQEEVIKAVAGIPSVDIPRVIVSIGALPSKITSSSVNDITVDVTSYILDENVKIPGDASLENKDGTNVKLNQIAGLEATAHNSEATVSLTVIWTFLSAVIVILSAVGIIIIKNKMKSH